MKSKRIQEKDRLMVKQLEEEVESKAHSIPVKHLPFKVVLNKKL